MIFSASGGSVEVAQDFTDPLRCLEAASGQHHDRREPALQPWRLLPGIELYASK
jgi:hypothetical protein